jgi:hypothetical protein
MQGYIALHRKTIESNVFQDDGLFKLWCYCLMRATHKERDFLHGGVLIRLRPGQFVTGRKVLTEELNSTEQKVRTRLALLEKMGNLTIKSTNKYSIITVVNWGYYQTERNKITNKQPTNNQQITTNNNDNNDNKLSEPKGSANLTKKDMWNTTSDDFADEVAIDLDGDGEMEEKKPQTRKYPNAPAVRKVFQEVLGKSPAAWKVNKNQLVACENLYTERGLER